MHFMPGFQASSSFCVIAKVASIFSHMTAGWLGLTVKNREQLLLAGSSGRLASASARTSTSEACWRESFNG
jgi:hypothetical protein